MRAISEIIIHCSASDVAGYDFNAIKRDHVQNRGWTDIGYHFGIDWDADIHILRPIEKPGAHCKGRNRYSIGICVLGLRTFTKWQMLQLARLCRMLMAAFELKEDDIKPHNFYNKNKTCPVFDLDIWKRDFLNGPRTIN